MDNSFLIKLGMNVDEVANGIRKSNELLNGFQEQVGEVGKSIIAAFGVEKLIEFTAEISKMAAEAAGVKNAFSEIGGATDILEKMRETTHNTVDDLSLMKDALRAQNLGIPLQDLGTILEFVHQRALATGQDFNSLAQTVITAIGKGGRGMIGAMSELQISTEDYKKALEETGSVTGAVMKLSEDALRDGNAEMDKTLLTIEQTSAAWANLKIAVGEYINSSTTLQSLLENVRVQLVVWQSDQVTWWEKLIGGAGDYEKWAEQIVETQKKMRQGIEDTGDVDPLTGLPTSGGTAYVQQQAHNLETIKGIQEEIDQLHKDQVVASGEELSSINQQIKALEQKIQLLKQQGIEQLKAAAPDSRNVAAAKLADIGGANTTQDAIIKQNEELSKSMEDLSAEEDAFAARPDPYKIPAAGAAKMLGELKDLQLQQKITSRLATELGSDLAQAFTDIVSGGESFAQAMAHFVKQFGEQMLQLALTSAIGAAMAHDGIKYGPLVGLAAAGAALVAVSGMFSKLGVSGGGGDGGSSPAGAIRGVDQQASNYAASQLQPMQIQVGGQFKLQGPDLVAAIKTSNYKAGILGGGN